MHFLLLSGSFSYAKPQSGNPARCAAGFSRRPHLRAACTGNLPFYSEDLNNNKPALVQAFIAAVTACDGILCCTPEYNHSIPAVLKNAIDWASRPAFHSPLKGKPVSIITQAVSPVGGARAQAHLKLVLDSTLSEIHLCHEMMIHDIDKVLDANMNIVDEKTLHRLQRHVESFITFASQKSAIAAIHHPH